MNINKINPSTLKITDMRFADIDGAPKRNFMALELMTVGDDCQYYKEELPWR